jgi:predicted exporter
MPGLMMLARRRRALLCLIVALITVATLPVVMRLRIDPDVLNLLPQSGTAVRAFRTYLSAFGSFDRVYVVFEVQEGESIDDHAPLVDKYAEILRREPEISRVDTQLFDPGKDWSYVFDHVFMLLGPDATAGAVGRLTAGDMSGDMARARDRLRLPSSAMKTLVRQDPVDYLGLLREHLSAANAFVRIDPTAEGYVSSDGRARLIIATPRRPPFDLGYSRRVKAIFDRAADAVRAEAAGDPDLGDASSVGIRFAGGYHLALETERMMRGEAFFNLAGSLGGILLLLLLVFRSPWLFFAGALPMAVGGLLAAAVVGLNNPNLSGAAAGASALLFGLGVDGLVLLYARYLEERPASGTAAEAIGRLGGSSASMLLGMFTSAATFLALTLVEFPSLRELGRIIGLGMLFGGVATFFLVPALLPATVKPRRPLRAPWLPAFIARRRRGVLWAAGLATVGLAAVAPTLRLDLSLDRLRPHTPQLAFEREIVRRFGLPEDLIVVLSEGPDLETLLRTNERLVDEVGRSANGLSVFSAAQGLPTAASQARVAEVLAKSGVSAADIGKRVTTAADAAGFRPDAFQPFLERVPRFLNPSSRLTFEGYKQHGLGELLSPYIARTPGGFAMAAYVHPRSPADLELMRSVVNRVGEPLRLTGMPVVNREMAASLVPQFLIGVGIGAVAVFVLMWLTFRNLRLTALALVPTVLGLIWGAGILALLGVVVDLFSLFGVLAFIGIGVDFGIHLVHRYASEGDLTEALARIAPVNLVAAGIAVLGCGTLITSSYPPLRSLGFVSVVTLITCVAGSVLVLPATLATSGRGPGAAAQSPEAD